jgi:hypothetical protein
MVILGGCAATAIDFLNVLNDAAALMLVRGADFLSVFDKPQAIHWDRGRPRPQTCRQTQGFLLLNLDAVEPLFALRAHCGRGRPRSLQDGSKLTHHQIPKTSARRGCDAVVLGCTEIPLIVRPDDTPLPTLDSTRLLARAALKRETMAKVEDLIKSIPDAHPFVGWNMMTHPYRSLVALVSCASPTMY